MIHIQNFQYDSTTLRLIYMMALKTPKYLKNYNNGSNKDPANDDKLCACLCVVLCVCVYVWGQYELD